MGKETFMKRKELLKGGMNRGHQEKKVKTMIRSAT